MARKKQEVALQLEIETQEEWEELLSKEGLIVIDVYQEWAGPCKSMIQYFRRFRNELSDSGSLTFAVAKADTVDCLERYREKCQPCFLFYAGGCLVAVIRGANAPLLSKTVLGELKKEQQVLKGEAERVEIRDPVFAHLETEKSATDESESEKTDERAPIIKTPGVPDSVYGASKQGDHIVQVDLSDSEGSEQSTESHHHTIDSAEMVPKEVTVALLKPDIVKEGKADEVLEKMVEAGIEILKHEERQLSEEEAKEFYGHLKDEPYFDELVQFMCSGPSHVLLLSKADDGKGIIEEWRELMGPKNVEDAKANAPDSLRSQYGTKEMLNALHGSDSHESAIRELAFFFTEYQVPKVPAKGRRHMTHASVSGVQRTLALIRPDALAEKRDEILKRIEESGFIIALQKEIQLTREQVEMFYSEHKEQSYYEELLTKMTSGPVLALGLARQDAVGEWRNLLGPTTVSEAKESAPQSLRAQYSVDGTDVNMLHGSDTVESANKELEFFFPVQQTVAVIKPDAYDNRDAIIEKIKEAGFHVAARKETTLTKDIAEMLYQQNKDAEYYPELVNHMTSGPTLFMVLTKEDAVENWRGVLGPTDPLQAKEQAPSSLRAAFGTDVKANALHGASTEESAKQVIAEVFGEIKYQSNGKVVDLDASQLHEGVEVNKPAAPATTADEKQATDEETTEQQGDMSEASPPEQTQQEGTEATPADAPQTEQEEVLAETTQQEPPTETVTAEEDSGQALAAEEQPATETAEEQKEADAPGDEESAAPAEQAPADTEQPPADTEQPPADTEQAPADNEASAEQTEAAGKDQHLSDQVLASHDQTVRQDQSDQNKFLTPEKTRPALTGSQTAHSLDNVPPKYVYSANKVYVSPVQRTKSQITTSSKTSRMTVKTTETKTNPPKPTGHVQYQAASDAELGGGIEVDSRHNSSPKQQKVDPVSDGTNAYATVTAANTIALEPVVSTRRNATPDMHTTHKPEGQLGTSDDNVAPTAAANQYAVPAVHASPTTAMKVKTSPSTKRDVHAPTATVKFTSSKSAGSAAAEPTPGVDEQGFRLASQGSRAPNKAVDAEDQDRSSNSKSEPTSEPASISATPELKSTATYMPTSSRVGSASACPTAELDDFHPGTATPVSISRAPSETWGEASMLEDLSGSLVEIQRSDSVSMKQSDLGSDAGDIKWGQNQLEESGSEYEYSETEDDEGTASPTAEAAAEEQKPADDAGEEKPTEAGEEAPAATE